MADNDDDGPPLLFATLDQFVALCFARSGTWGSGPCLLDKPGKGFMEYTQVSRPPTQPFQSEYLGKTVNEIVPIFQNMVGQIEPLTHATCTFIILDEQTLVDSSVCGVSVLGGLLTLRADFHMVIEMLGMTEIMQHHLDEDTFKEFYTKGETVTLEGWNAQEGRWRNAEEDRKARKKDEGLRVLKRIGYDVL